MKTISLLCLALIVLTFGCGLKNNNLTAEECYHYRKCYVYDLINSSTCSQMNTQFLKEKMPQLERATIVQKCLLDKDKARDECYGTESESVRMSKIEKCRKIGLDPTKPMKSDVLDKK